MLIVINSMFFQLQDILCAKFYIPCDQTDHLCPKEINSDNHGDADIISPSSNKALTCHVKLT